MKPEEASIVAMSVVDPDFGIKHVENEILSDDIPVFCFSFVYKTKSLLTSLSIQALF